MEDGTLCTRPIITVVSDVAPAGRTVLAAFPTGCTPDQGTAVKHVSLNEKKNEESESFIYIRDILFILADKLGSLRALTSNGLSSCFRLPASPIPTRHCFSPITSRLDGCDTPS